MAESHAGISTGSPESHLASQSSMKAPSSAARWISSPSAALGASAPPKSLEMASISSLARLAEAALIQVG